MDEIIKVTDETFDQEVLQDHLPILVDFWAEWCGPCQTINPILEALAVDMKGTLKVTKMNIDDCPNTPTEYGVRGIPTLILFKDGKMTSRKVGALSKGQLYQWVESNLGEKSV